MEELSPIKKESYWDRKIKPNLGMISIVFFFIISIFGGILFTSPELFKGEINIDEGHTKKECSRDADCDNVGGIYFECINQECKQKQCKDIVPCPENFACTQDHNCIESFGTLETTPEKGFDQEESLPNEQISYSLINEFKFTNDEFSLKFHQQKQKNDTYGFIVFNSKEKIDLTNELTQNDYFLEDYLYDVQILTPSSDLIFNISNSDLTNYFNLVLDDDLSDIVYIYPFYIEEEDLVDAQCISLWDEATKDSDFIIRYIDSNTENVQRTVFDQLKTQYDLAYPEWNYVQSSAVEQRTDCTKREICEETLAEELCYVVLECPEEGSPERLTEDEEISLELEYLVDQISQYIQDNQNQLIQDKQLATSRIAEILAKNIFYKNVVRDKARSNVQYDKCVEKAELIKNSLSEIWKIYINQGEASLIQSYEQSSTLLEEIETFQYKVEENQDKLELIVSFKDINSDIITNTEYNSYVLVWSENSLNDHPPQSPFSDNQIIGDFSIVEGQEEYEKSFDLEDLSDFEPIFISILPAYKDRQDQYQIQIPKTFTEEEVEIISEVQYEEHQKSQNEEVEQEKLEQGQVQCNLEHPCPEGYYCGQSSICRPMDELE